jgi:hypothetical protein
MVLKRPVANRAGRIFINQARIYADMNKALINADKCAKMM